MHKLQKDELLLRENQEKVTMIDGFEKYMSTERNLSKHTVQAYTKDLKQYECYLRTFFPEHPLEKANQSTIRAWMVTLAQQGLSNRSINRKIASLKAFYRFSSGKAYIAKDPTLLLKTLRVKRKLPVFLKRQELLTLLDRHPFKDNFIGWRSKLVLELLYGTGIRLSELLTLRDEAVDLYNGTIRVQGKRSKDRLIPFPKSLRKVIEKYRYHRAATIRNHNELLLVTAKGAPCYPMLVYRLVNKYLRAYTQAEQHSPHVLRHTFATHLLHNGANLKAIKDLLGHENLATTQLYTHHSFKKLQEVFKQAHPRA
mmetsp:Transcript_10281/g.23758  ORF Transcript_10281/g.23758 Transcript_10281/m.23758 type:complete len:312 (-) Transcript_10281:437-1372(-)